MNRRDFGKTAGSVVAAAVVAPSILGESLLSINSSNFSPLGWLTPYQEGNDYVIGVITGDHLKPSVISVWSKGTSGKTVKHAGEFTVPYEGLNETLLTHCMYIASKYENCHPDGPMFSIEQVAAPGDTIQHLLKINGYKRFYKTVRYSLPSGEKDRTVLDKAFNLQYKEKSGWYSTSWSKPLIVERFLSAYKNNWLTVGSSMRKYLDGAEYKETSKGKKLVFLSGNENRFMAAAIAYNSITALDQLRNSVANSN